jgi:trafficking protein particle complex subunit 11
MRIDSATIGTVNHISFGADRSPSMIKGLSFGSFSPGETVKETLLLHSTGAPGDRTIDVSVQCSHSVPSTSTDADAVSLVSPQPTADISETLHTLVISTRPSLQVESLVSYRRAIQPSACSPLGLADLESYDSSTLTAQAEAVIRSTIVNEGPWDVVIKTFSLLPVCDRIVSQGGALLH